MPDPDPAVAQPVYLPVAHAALRLGITQQAVRRRIARGTLETRREVRGNRTFLLVRLPEPAVAQHGDQPVAPRGEQPVAPAVAPELLAEKDRTIARLEGEVADLRAGRDRLLAIMEHLTAERADSKRRPWPGMRQWWRRVWEGEG